MLVLTRQKDQRIIIEVGGTRLELTIVELRGDKVRLGFEGPDSFKVLRAEICKAVTAENLDAAKLTPADLSMRIVPGPKANGRSSGDPERN